MQIITWNLAALAIAAIYYSWREGHLRTLHRQQLLCQRVAQMLWVVAEHA